MGEPVSVGALIRGARVFTSGAITGATAHVLLGDLRRRLDERDAERWSLTAAGEERISGEVPDAQLAGSYRAVCRRCRSYLFAELDDGRIHWVDAAGLIVCTVDDTGAEYWHQPISGRALADLGDLDR